VTPLSIINKIQFANDTIGFALGDYGIFKTNNAGEILSILEPVFNYEIKVFPNPTSDILNIEFTENVEVRQFLLFNLNGEAIKSFNPTERNLNLKGLGAGLYFLRIETEKGVITKKVQIE